MSLSDQIKQNVRKATQEDLMMDDWDSIILLCDLLGQKPDEASPVVIRAVNDRLQSGNAKIQRLALTLLDACVKNAGDYFHKMICEEKNLVVIERLASSSQEVGAQVKEMVTEWAREYGVRMPGFQRSLARINGEEPPLRVEAQRSSDTADYRLRGHGDMEQTEERPFNNLKEKIRADVKTVRDTIQILREMVAAANTVDDVKTEACIQVIVNCREMHRRLITLIESEPEEDLLLELIDLNDELYSTIEEHDQFRRTGRKKHIEGQPLGKGKSPMEEGEGRVKEKVLLDSFMEDNTVQSSQSTQESRTASRPVSDLDAFLFGSQTSAPSLALSAQTNSSTARERKPHEQQQQPNHPLEDPFADLIISSPDQGPQQQQQQQQQQGSQKRREDIYPPL